MWIDSFHHFWEKTTRETEITLTRIPFSDHDHKLALCAEREFRIVVGKRPPCQSYLDPSGHFLQKMVERIDPHFLGPSVPSGYLPIHSRKGKSFFVKRWTRTSAKCDMMMPYLPDIDASPSSSHTSKVKVPTRKG